LWLSAKEEIGIIPSNWKPILTFQVNSIASYPGPNYRTLHNEY